MISVGGWVVRSGGSTMTNGTEIHLRSSVILVGFLTLTTGNCMVSPTALAGEFHFVVHDVEGDAAAWSPREVVIHKRTDLQGGLIFVLELWLIFESISAIRRALDRRRQIPEAEPTGESAAA